MISTERSVSRGSGSKGFDMTYEELNQYIKERMPEWIRKIEESPEGEQRREYASLINQEPPYTMTSEEFAAYIKENLPQWIKEIRESSEGEQSSSEAE